MPADTEFLEELILGLDTATLEWLALRIGRVLKARHPEITARRAIIRGMKMTDEIKGITIDCPVCEKETTITTRDIKLAIQHKKDTGGLILVSCNECCRALVLPEGVPQDGAELEEWIVKAAADPDDLCPCVPMLDPEQEKIPAGSYADLGVTFYRPGGGGQPLKKREYMYNYGINPACHIAKNPGMGGVPFRVS